MTEHIETIIIGGGQAGLAVSYHLAQARREHVVLEQAAQAASVWRSQRWDSFTLVTPNWSLRMPGAEYDGPDPHGYLPRSEIIDYFDSYVVRFRLPVQIDTQVISIAPLDGQSARPGYRVETSEGALTADNVVVATGFYQKPKTHAAAVDLSPAITQLPSSRYRNPDSLPPGAVLVVGSAQSGCQIAEELYQHGRQVFLCTGSAGRAPRRYRGKDIIAWLDLIGFFDLEPEQLPPGMGKFDGIPHFSGTRGGHSLNLHQFAKDGVTLLGHLRSAAGDRVWLAPDLHENLSIADQFELEATMMIDGYIQSHGLDAPPEALPDLRNGLQQPVIDELDLRAAGIRTIIWAMGYSFDYSLVKLPVQDENGFPIQKSGVTRFPGLYFAGMPWMPTERSGFLIGVGKAAEKIAMRIAAPTSEIDAGQTRLHR